MMFWESKNLEISVFESRVVRLRTGKIALNTFKNIHLQSNIFESSEEGQVGGGCPRCARPHQEWLVGSGPCVAGAQGKLLAADSLPGHSAFDRLLTKGKEGWFYLQSRAISVEYTWKLAWQVEQAPRWRLQKDQAHSLVERTPLRSSQGESLSFSLTSVFLASCRKRSWLHLSLKFLFHFTKGHSTAVSRREKQLSTLSCSLLLSTDGSEEHSGVSQRCVLLQAAQGNQTLLPGSDELL